MTSVIRITNCKLINHSATVQVAASATTVLFKAVSMYISDTYNNHTS